MFMWFFIALLSFSLTLSPVLAQEGPYREAPKGKGGVGPGIILPFILIPMLIQKLTQGQPTYPTLDKKPLNITQSGNTYTVDWVVYYANNTNTTQNNVTITEGPINTIVPGSLQQPAGWTGTLNSTNTIATWTGNAPPINGYMTATVSTSMASSFNVVGSGDGYRAIPYRHMASGGKLRIYFINHHEPPTSQSLNVFKCVDTSTGNYCPSFPKKLPKGDSSGKYSSSGMYDEEYYIDPSGKLYYAATANDGEFGLGCYNLETDTECGFYKLGVKPNPSLHYSYVKGPWKVGNELYMVDGAGKLYCLNASNPASFCTGLSSYYTGFTFPVGAFPNPSNGIAGMSWGPAVFGEVVGNKLYFITDSNPTGVPKQIKAFCFDTTLKSTCSGWTVSTQTHTLPMTYPRVWSSFIYYDTTMIPKHICTRLNQTSQYCFDLSSGNPSTPSVIFNSINISNALGSEVIIGTKTYFPDMWYNALTFNPSRVLCWDWSTGALCAPNWEFKSWTKDPRDYTTNVDDRGCIWVLGDNAPAMWYFDPSKPPGKDGIAQKCEYKDGTFNYTFQPWKYCSGPKPFKWLAVEIANATLSDFNKLEIKVKDSSNNTIFTYDCIANNSLIANITSIDPQTNGQPLKVEISYTLATGSNLQQFEVRAYYSASPLEFCFKSQHKCEEGPVKNTVSVSGIEKPPGVEVELPKPDKCGEVAGGGQPPGGTPASPSSGGGQPPGGSQSGGSGIPPEVILLTPSPIPSPEGAGSSVPIGGGKLVEKEGQVQILPETKQRCYWRPKQKPVAQTQAKPKKPAVKKPVAKKETPSSQKTIRPTAQKPKKPVVKKVVKPKEPEMEYICEPEK